MSRVILIGGFHELEELCMAAGITLAGYIDMRPAPGLRAPHLGGDGDAAALVAQHGDACFHVTPDKPSIRRKLWAQYEALGARFTSLVHPTAIVSPGAAIGAGCVLQAATVVSSASVLGRAVKMNTGATVTHDVRVGDFVTLAPRAVICSAVVVGDGAYIGANATILPGVRIGENAVIGAGAVVTRDVAAGAVAAGNPARERAS